MTYKVVVNHEEQYSIWLTDRENARGWKDAGNSGSKTECLAYIKEVWIDIRPLSLRKKMEESNQSFRMPFAFFGHNMGALISFELARQLRKHYSLNPVHLFVSGRGTPQIPEPDPPIHQLPEPAFVEELRRLNGTPDSVLQNAELMQLVLPVLRADFELCETYVYSTEKPLDCPISAFGGLQDGEVSYDDLPAWREQTNSSFMLRMIPGKHFFLQSARSLILSALYQDLTQHLIHITGGQRS